MATHTRETGTQEFERACVQKTITLATDNVTNNGGPFGALVARDGEVLATGRNEVTAALDPVAHAEVTAIRAACTTLDAFSLEGCILVASCEPCPMCLSAALWARIDRLIYCADRHDAAMAGFDDRTFHELFEKKPEPLWPMSVEQLDLPDRMAPFHAWLAKSDRITY